MSKSSDRVLIYIPTYDCERTIVGVLDEIPASVWARAEVWVVDNQSSDRTVAKVLAGNAQSRWAKTVKVIQPTQNQGYAGSQKLAYRLALADPQGFQAVLMLHGDGQYDPKLIPQFLKELSGPEQIVYGYRSWRWNWKSDETPIFAYLTIKSLSVLESAMTGYWRREWHSGMVMHKRGFLEKVNLTNITSTMHMDGHLLFAAGRLGLPVKGLPIYKRYKNYEALKPSARVRYVFNVLKLIPRLHFIPVGVTAGHKPAPLPEHKVMTIEAAPLEREITI